MDVNKGTADCLVFQAPTIHASNPLCLWPIVSLKKEREQLRKLNELKLYYIDMYFIVVYY